MEWSGMESNRWNGEWRRMIEREEWNGMEWNDEWNRMEWNGME